MFEPENCPVCDRKLTSSFYGMDTNYGCSCETCGDFFISFLAKDFFRSNPLKKESAKISAYLRNRHILGLPKSILYMDSIEAQKVPYGISFDQIVDQFPKLISDRLDLVLLNLAKKSSYSGEFIKISTNDSSLFYADKNNVEAQFYIMKQLIDDNLIELNDNGLTLPNGVRLTPKGWNKVVELEQGGHKDNTKVFIAMSFHPSLATAYEQGIAKAISVNGYDPIRVDYEEHIDQISDRIIANIRKCKYVVADFTFNRGGVYFEAGFAKGLGKPVIWTCREDHLDGLHFDTRQYNHIVWTNDQDLYDKLDTRIKAIFMS